MKVETGYLYHIKDEFFDKINKREMMINHENGHSRPSYLAIKDKDILCFIPLSSKVDKIEKKLNLEKRLRLIFCGYRFHTRNNVKRIKIIKNRYILVNLKKGIR